MGYSCTTAALRTLQAVKENHGADLAASNEIRTFRGALVFFERDAECADGGISGTVTGLNGLRYGRFHVTGSGVVVKFPGLTKRQRAAAEMTAKRISLALLDRWAVI